MSQTQSTTYKIKGMECSSCASMLELDLEDVNCECVCDFAKETLEIKSGDVKIVEEVVKKSGYEIILKSE